MNPQSIELLSDEAIDAVSGGMTCVQAQGVSKNYAAFADVLKNLGMDGMATEYYGRAAGVIEGGCR
jgi:hypothetical protein